VSSPLVNMPPFHRFCVGDDNLRIDRLGAKRLIVHRADSAVRFARWGTPRRYLFFLVTADGSFATNLAFVPWSGRRLLRVLERHGWHPVEDASLLSRWQGGVA